ncbi:TPA: hypothetical protein OV554_003739 [Acinetobacter baumannii]|nr:hypothetical protein [Acinetobacter baumannii]
MKSEDLKIYIENCQNLLHMVGELYKRGYESIQPIPNVREGTGRWRLFLQSGDSNLIAVHQWFADLGKPELLDSEYEKTQCHLTIKELADKFIEDNGEWLQKSKLNSVNGLFVEWYQVFLTTLKEGDSAYVATMHDGSKMVYSKWVIQNTESKSVEVIPCNLSPLKFS